MNFSYTSNVGDVIRDMEAASKEAQPAVARAMNRVIRTVKVRAARYVRDAGYKLKISEIKAQIALTLARPGSLKARALARGKAISLINYGARQVAAGVSVDVLNGRKVIKGAFIANAYGEKGVYERLPGKGMHVRIVRNGKVMWSQFPIKRLYGPSIPDALINEKVRRAIIELIEEGFPARLAHEHSWLKKRLDRLPSNPVDET